ncbi:MAG: FtsX-like permease family protein [Myxococcota bacterium]
MNDLSYWRVLVTLSLRNLLTHRIKTLVVGGLIFFGTALVVLGTALLDSVELSMSRSITSSLAGQLQIYSKKAKDKLALFGGAFMGAEDIGRIPSIEALKETALKVDNVEAVVPMGLDMASITGGNDIDRLTTELRAAVKAEQWDRAEVLIGQMRQISVGLKEELTARLKISSKPEEISTNIANLDSLQGPALWEALHGPNPEPTYQFLETKIAPLSTEGLLIYIRYLGTDIEEFKHRFDKFKVVKGSEIPKNQRGFLFNDKFYEDHIKHKVARDLDQLFEALTEKKKTIATDPALKTIADQVAKQQRRITYELEPAKRPILEEKLRTLLKLPDPALKLEDLVTRFLTVDDSNLVERHKFFYDVIAPMVELYQVKVGDVLTITAFTRSGYLKSVNVKVYGTFKFDGLDKSELAGGHNIMDLMTFRDLYGFMDDARLKELADIKASAGVKDVNRATAEEELFGEGAGTVKSDTATGFDEFEGAKLTGERERMDALMKQVFDQRAIDDGMALNAAVILKDPKKLWETKKSLEAALAAAKLDVQVIDWQTAAGIVGQFIWVIRAVLYIAIFIIFLVALVIINNSMVMATMDRVTEIGTMRAIGAQRAYVMWMFLVETLVLGFIAGTLGAGAGAGLVTMLGHNGIPAATDVLVFLFGGPKLYPAFSVGNLSFAFVVVMLVSLVSTLYPARLATRIQPVVAMQTKE